MSGFIEYRNKLQDEYNEEIKDLKYYRENKEFLVDKRTITESRLTVQQQNLIRDQTIRTYSKEIIKYVKMAVELGKTDIEKFVLTLIDIS